MFKTVVIWVLAFIFILIFYSSVQSPEITALNKAHQFMKIKKFDLALFEFQKVLEINPNNLEAYLGKARVYRNRGDLTHEIIESSKAIDIDYLSAVAYSFRGEAYLRQNKLKLALADLNKSINDDLAYPIDSYYNRARLYSMIGEPKNAWADMTCAKGINPQYHIISALYKDFNTRPDWQQ